MNSDRRKRLSEAAVLLEQAQGIVADVQQEESDAYDSLPEGLQESERGQRMSEIADDLYDIASELTDFIDRLNFAQD